MNATKASTRTFDLSLIGIARRHAELIDPALALFTEAEAAGINEANFDAFMPFTPRTEPAQRLAIAFMVAGTLGMPEHARLALFTDWATTAFAVAPQGEIRRAIVRAVEFAQVIMGEPLPEQYPDLRAILLKMDHDEPNELAVDTASTALLEIATWTRHAVERYTSLDGSPQHTDPWSCWADACNMLGSIERAGGEAAIAACAEVFRKHALAWGNAA